MKFIGLPPNQKRRIKIWDGQEHLPTIRRSRFSRKRKIPLQVFQRLRASMGFHPLNFSLAKAIPMWSRDGGRFGYRGQSVRIVEGDLDEIERAWRDTKATRQQDYE